MMFTEQHLSEFVARLNAFDVPIGLNLEQYARMREILQKIQFSQETADDKAELKRLYAINKAVMDALISYILRG